jgi:hypothetical protein
LLGLAEQTYSIYDVSGGGVPEPLNLKDVIAEATVYTAVDIDDCKCTRDGCLGIVKLKVGFKWKGKRNHPDNTHGRGPGTPPDPSIADPRAYLEFSDGSFYPRPSKFIFDGPLNADGTRNGNGATMTIEFTIERPCAGGSAIGSILLSNGLHTHQQPWVRGGGMLIGLVMFKVNFSVEIEDCGIVKRDEVSLEVGRDHPANYPTGPWRKPVRK